MTGTHDSFGSYESTFYTRNIELSVTLLTDAPSPGEWYFLAILNGCTFIEGKWEKGSDFETSLRPVDLKDPDWQHLIADRPLILLLRTTGTKGPKDPDPLLNVDNRAGATVDLYPLVAGEEEVYHTIPLVFIDSGAKTPCSVEVYAKATNPVLQANTQTLLTLTMLSVNCIPYVKEGTCFIGAIGLDNLVVPDAVNFGKTLSNASATKYVWASASNAGHAADSELRTVDRDMFIPEDLDLNTGSECRVFYWNSIKRVLVDPEMLLSRLGEPFFFEMAGVPKVGKVEVRGRYIAFIDAKPLMEPGQFSVTVAAKLSAFTEIQASGKVLLELPSTSAKPSAREPEAPVDEFGHSSYIRIRFDLIDPLVPRKKMAVLYETIGLVPPEGPSNSVAELVIDPPPEDTTIDVRKIRIEGGALAVHKELSGLACRGVVPMNQGIKRTAANRLLMRVRAMLKQFPPGECSYVEWQDIVTSQHAASRRAVTASFDPQPPPPRLPPKTAIARSRLLGDEGIANRHLNYNLQWAPHNPRTLLCKALRCLEAHSDIDAKNYILEGLNVHPRCRFLLWMFGAQEYDKGIEAEEMALAAFLIAAKGNNSDGTSTAISYAAIHAFNHYIGENYAAYVAGKKMRKAYELPPNWVNFIGQWIEISGEEEIFWTPRIVCHVNPLLIAAAFFLCLRCFKFCECLLRCVEKGCATKGGRFFLPYENSIDLYYIRGASFILKRYYDEAMAVIAAGIKAFGHTAKMSQLRVSCLSCMHEWGPLCDKALKEADNAGSEVPAAFLLKSALHRMKTDPMEALQRAAHAHRLVPSGQTALVFARIYNCMGDDHLAELWAAAAVRTEPLLADGWGLLALIALNQRNVDKARTMLRTVQEVGTMSEAIENEINKLMTILKVRTPPDLLVQNLCFCDYFDLS